MQSESQPSVRTSSWSDRFWAAGFVVGLLAIMFLWGMITAIRQAPPYRTVRDAWLGLNALVAQQDLLDSEFPAYLWTPTTRTERGLTKHDTAQAYDGYTLYTSSHDGSVVLVDIDGKEVHRWTIPFRKIWPHPRHVPTWVPDHFVHIRKAHVYANGDLLAVYSTTANTPSGCGMVRVDKDGHKIWSFDENAHHDFDVGPDGTIYALTHRLRHLNRDDDQLAPLSTIPLIEDSVTILSPDGQESKTFSILDALVASPFFRPLLCHVDRYGDITHTNTVDVIGEEFASHYEGVTAGDVMVCLRNLGVMAILNPQSESIVWATTGPWNHPHDPDPLPNGNVLIFDNYVARGARHGSAVLEFDPRARDIIWQYLGSEEHPLRSDIRSRQQQLPNGNVLVTESDYGRLLEVSRNGDIVWEFINPIRGGEAEELVPIVCGGHRYEASELPFLHQADGVQPNGSIATSVTVVD